MKCVVAAVLVVCTTSLVTSVNANWKLNVFYLNDMNYDIFPLNSATNTTTETCLLANASGCFGGVGRLKDLVDILIKPSTKSNDSANIWLNAGQVLGSRVFRYDVLKFDAGALINGLNFDAVALEPAVFKYGLEASRTYAMFLSEVIAASNVQQMTRSRLIPVANSPCYVAVIGFVEKASTDSMKIYGVQIADEYTAIQDEIKAIQTSQKDKKILYIALGSASVETATSLAKIPDLDLVIFSGGNFSDDENANKWSYFVPVINGGKWTYIASIRKNFNTFDQRYLVGEIALNLTDSCKVDGEVQPVQKSRKYQDTSESTDDTMNKYIKDEFIKIHTMDQVAAKSKVSLLPSNLSCRVGECSLGNMIADAMVEKLNDLTPDVAWNQSVKMAVFPANLIANRNTVNVTGDITPRHLYNFLSQDEYLYTVTLSGKLLRRMFEMVVFNQKKSTDRMDNLLQVSEYLRIEYEPGYRKLCGIQVLTQTSANLEANYTYVDLNNEKVNYTVAVPFSMLYASDTYDFLRTANVTYYPATVSAALTSHITRGGVGYLALPAVGNRIVKNSHLDEICVNHTAKIVILTILILLLIALVITVIWKYILPRYNSRSHSMTDLAP